MRNNKFRPHVDQKCLPFPHCTPTHITTTHHTNPCTKASFSTKSPGITNNIMVRSTEERFAMERMATRGLGSKKMAQAFGVSLSTKKRWLRRIRSDGDMTSNNMASRTRVYHRLALPLKTAFFEQWSWDFDVCRSNTQCRNTSSARNWHSMTLSTDTDETTDTDNMWKKPCCFVTHIPTQKLRQNGPGRLKNPKFDPLSGPLFFYTTVPHMVENTVQKRGVPSFGKIRIFSMRTFSFTRNTFL